MIRCISSGNAQVQEIQGDDMKVTGVKYRDKETGEGMFASRRGFHLCWHYADD